MRQRRRVVGMVAAGLLVGTLAAAGPGASAAIVKPVTAKQVQRVTRGLVDVDVILGYAGATGEGTGMVLTHDGEILTNNHVVRGATSISVVDLHNDRTYAATVVGYDADADVAVLQLQGASGLQTAPIGDSATVRKGAAVAAVGNAGGTGGVPAVARGTVTALHQAITADDELYGPEQLSGLIETDANLQAGDSGGPLVAADGTVVGMDTAGSTGFSLEGASQTQAYAIPIDKALRLARAMVAGKASASVHVGATAFVGVSVEQARYLANGTTATGLVVTTVVPGSPAQVAGIVAGDAITSFDGVAVSDPTSFEALIGSVQPGASVEIGWFGSKGAGSATITLVGGPAE